MPVLCVPVVAVHSTSHNHVAHQFCFGGWQDAAFAAAYDGVIVAIAAVLVAPDNILDTANITDKFRVSR